ncbi:ARM repeat-containing protein [Multifurca ochricompacta]|uniref:ARM repeat-containing protein n=1 Tax=Multifurca ochricompacta TaxID=376703 RepID=A0AAD4QRK6_9AGAM|nr:ARM repeat-containing protein [Multifurca ochricompacta]
MDGQPPQEEDFSVLSIEDRLAHKNWKARVGAYETLVKTFQLTASDTDPAFRPYISNPDILKKIVTDSNVVAQEKGVECVIAFVKFAGENAARTRDAVVPALVDKCFGSTRAGTKNQAIELALQYVEVENGGAGVVENVLLGLTAKQPKAVAGTVTVLKEIVRLFGTQVTPSAPILKALPKIFGHSDKSVRLEGSNLAHALYQYLGAGIEPWLADLKPVQVKELKEVWDGMERDGRGKGTLKPERMTRQQARDAEQSAAAGEGGAGDSSAAAEEDFAPPDPRQFAEEVDITPKLPANLHTNLTSSKWKERKEVLDDLLTVLNTTHRIKEASEFGELSKALALRVQSDANINCVMVAAQCLEGLAKGLMGNFARYRETVVPPMLERLKERKANVTDTIGATLDAIFETTTLADIVGDILPALSSKNPQVKEGACRFLTRCLSTSKQAIPPPQVKPVSESLATLLEDSYAGARDEAANALGTLMKMVGERPLGAVMDGLADVRKAKVKEAHEKATVKTKAGAGGPPKPPVVVPAKAPSKKIPAVVAKKEEPPSAPEIEGSLPEDNVPTPEKKTRGPSARLLAKKVSPAVAAANSGATVAPVSAPTKKSLPAAAAAVASKQPKGGAPALAGALDTFKYKHTPEDAEALAAELIPSNLVTDLGDANWKTRLAALEEMTTWVESMVDELDAEVVIRALGKKGWGEKNFQVSAKLYGILVILAERCPSFGRSCAALSIPHLSEKLGDAKLKKPASDALGIFAEKTSLQFVLNQAYEPLNKIKAPKALADALGWIEQALSEFGIAGLSLRGLIEFLKGALKNSNAAVRTSATRTVVMVKMFAGSSVSDLLGDLNPQLLTTIQSEFEKVEGTPAPEPMRQSADVLAMAPQGGSGGKSGATAASALDDLFPRVEIDGLIKGTTILADAKSEAWKAKKEALETLQAILDQGANKRLKPQMGEIGQILKARVTDSNKAVQTLALDIVARIATGMGKSFEKQTRFFVLPVCTVLSDQKAPIRAAAIQALTAIATACEGLDALVHGLTAALEVNQPLQRAQLLGWIVDWFKEHEITPGLDLSSCVAPVVGCLDDRNGDVRKGAQAVLPYLIASAGFDQVMNQTNSLKPASKATAAPLIQAARAAAPTGAVAAATSAVSAPTTAPVPPKVAISSKPAAANPPPSPPESSPPQSPSAAVPPTGRTGPASKLGSVRRKLPLGSTSRPESRTETIEEAVTPRASTKLGGLGLKRPGLAASTSKSAPPSVPVSAAPSQESLPLSGMSLDVKRVRLLKDVGKWINEGGATRKDLADLLQHQMEPNASKDLIANLFSHDHNAVNDHVNGLTMLCDFYTDLQAGGEGLGLTEDDARAIGVANSDLALKYVSIKAHEPQSNLVSKCLDVIDAVLGFMRNVEYQLTEPEALCFIPTLVHKFGDAREPVRVRVQQIFQTLPKVYAYSRVFQVVLDHGLKSKVAKTRQLSLDELGGILKRSGMGACHPAKDCPPIASMISDKDPNVRKSALSTLSEIYLLEGEKVWSLVGSLSAKDKTQLEERLRRVAGPSTADKRESGKQDALVLPQPSQISRLTSSIARPASPSTSLPRPGGIPRPGSPPTGSSRLAQPAPAASARSMSPGPSHIARPTSHIPGPTSPTGRGKSMLPSRLAAPRSRAGTLRSTLGPSTDSIDTLSNGTKYANGQNSKIESWRSAETPGDPEIPSDSGNNITLTISSILSSDSDRSVEALKKVQKILQLGPDNGPSSPLYRDLAEHTEGLIETVTLQMSHAFDKPDENIRLAKHLIQTLNAFCDNSLLAESLTVDIFTALFEELALRLLQTDDSQDKEVKNLSRFINMIMLRLFSTGRRITVFRALFTLLLHIARPFPVNGTLSDSQEAKVAELVLKCIWKLARNIPQDLTDLKLDPVELFPAVEHFLQTVPPNEWRARSTNRVPCGDMPLRTVKVIIQHVVAHYGDEVYDILSNSFDDPSATIVYPYVYRILNSGSRAATEEAPARSSRASNTPRSSTPGPSRPVSPPETASDGASGDVRRSSPSHHTSRSVSSINGLVSPPIEEPDPDAQLLKIIGHISSETTGAMHKEGITELHQFLKAYPHKKPKVDKMLESTGPAFRKYISRALATRAAEDEEREVAVADTLSKLESRSIPNSPMAATFNREDQPHSPISPTAANGSDREKRDKLSRLHDIFQYRTSTMSTSSHGRSTPAFASSNRSPPA